MYHVTPHADAVLAEGFRDGIGSYGLSNFTLRGVFISDQLVGPEEASGELLELELPDDLDLSYWEIVEEDSPAGWWRREWCVPVSLLNRVAKATRAPEENS
jgi:hypothetical protein